MLKIGDRYTVEITDMGNEGEGIGRVEGIAVFIPGVITGDHAEIEVSYVKKNFARGKMLQITTPSPIRVEAPCKYSGQCGGCSLQEMSYEGQLKLKKKMVADALERIGGIKEPMVHDTIGMDVPYRYRNKAQLPISGGELKRKANGRWGNSKACSIGFYKVKSHDVVNCNECLIQAETAEKAAVVLRQFIDDEGLTAYDDKSGKGLFRHLIVRTAFDTGEVMIILVMQGAKFNNVDKLVELFDAAIDQVPGAELASVIININKKKGSEIMGDECITIAGKPTITDRIGDLEFEISPQSFYQVNPVQMKALYDTAVSYAGLTGTETVLDLYCGVGTIGLYCAKQAKRVIGIESVRGAILDANRNAVINGIVNASYVCGRAETELPKLVEEEGVTADVVILDPPRTGCAPELLDAVLAAEPKRIVYVSCNPGTLARDVKHLCADKYEFVQAQPVDMFGQTMHVECVCLMTRKEK